MNAHIAHAMESASAIAIETATRPKVSAEIITFRPKEPQAEPVTDTVVEDTTSIEAQNDNEAAPLPPADPEFGASALIERASLTRAVEIVTNVVAKRNTFPVLSNVCMRGNGEAITLIGTDEDIEIKVTIPAAADREFGTTLTAHLLKDLLKKATVSEYVAFTTGEDRDIVDFERVRYEMQPLPTSYFPELKAPGETAVSLELPGNVFWNAIAATKGAVSTEETRYYLNGIYFHTPDAIKGTDAPIRFVATDGHRLYMQDIEAPEGFGGMPGVIIPRKTVELLHKLMKGKACPKVVSITLDEKKLRFAFGDVVITSKVIDGTFPDYMRVIPQHNDKRAVIDAATALEAIRAVTLISSERGRACKYTFSNGNCQLSVNNPDSGSAIADIPVDYEGDDLEIGFNASYSTDIITDAVGDGSSFTISMNDAGGPAILTGDRAGWMGVLMPMRV